MLALAHAAAAKGASRPEFAGQIEEGVAIADLARLEHGLAIEGLRERRYRRLFIGAPAAFSAASISAEGRMTWRERRADLRPVPRQLLALSAAVAGASIAFLAKASQQEAPSSGPKWRISAASSTRRRREHRRLAREHRLLQPRHGEGR